MLIFVEKKRWRVPVSNTVLTIFSLAGTSDHRKVMAAAAADTAAQVTTLASGDATIASTDVLIRTALGDPGAARVA